VDLCLIAVTSEDIYSYLSMIPAIGMVAAGLGFVIFVHELGHFLAAKACGVKAEKFYVGFDIPMPKIFGWQIPSTFGKFKYGETEYGIGILPLGGYVKMLGQDDDPRKYKDEQARAKHDDTAAVVTTPLEPIPDKPHSAFDPRSYQAKSVPQRMLIISAGVIMNLIFAVLMAAVAYSIGVPYTPTIIGHAPAGSTGWVKDLRPGDHVVRLQENGRVSDSFRWQQDLLPGILLNGGAPAKILVKREGVEQPLEVEVQGVKRPDSKHAMLGIKALPSTTIYETELPKRMAAAKVEDLKPGDKVVAIDGQPVESFVEVQETLAMKPGKTLTFKLERAVKDSNVSKAEEPQVSVHEVQLPPQPLRSLGLVMTYGPVSAVRLNSPAQATDIKPGDVLVSFDGKPLGDVFTLSQRLLPYVGRKGVDIEIRRPSSDKKSSQLLARKISPVAPIYMEDGADPFGGDQVGLEPLGIALPVLPVIASVDEGSPAAKVGLKAGDELVGAQFLSEVSDDIKWLTDRRADKVITLNQEGRNWAFVFNLLQKMPESVKLGVTYRREGKLLREEMTPVDSEAGFFEPRGLEFDSLTRIRTAAGVGEALSLGVRETKEKLQEVGKTLKALLTGKVDPREAGGPIMIARVAYMEASEGWGRLLIFLTFLSANLALINFLPIPVLDGGHMVFLAAEGIRGKPVDEHVQYYALLVGAAMLLCLMVFVFSNDIWKLVT
jgi:regulator of sigma E protease